MIKELLLLLSLPHHHSPLLSPHEEMDLREDFG